MDAKLTLTLNKQLIEKAKKYALRNNKSLSQIVELHLRLLTSKEEIDEMEEVVISNFVKSLTIQTNLSAGLDYKKEYKDYLNEKY